MLVLYSQAQDDIMLDTAEGASSEVPSAQGATPYQVSMCTFFDKVKSAMLAKWEVEIVKKSSHLLKYSTDKK